MTTKDISKHIRISVDILIKTHKRMSKKILVDKLSSLLFNKGYKSFAISSKEIKHNVKLSNPDVFYIENDGVKT